MADFPLKQRFVIDTSSFLTEEIREENESFEQALDRVLDLIAAAKVEHNISCYMPPSVYEEFVTMLEDRDTAAGTWSKLNTWIIKKNPKRYEVMIPAELVYGFIDEMSDRINRGLRVAEKAVRKTEESRSEPIEHDHMTRVDQVISELRDEYRSTLRRGVLDSREDFDLLVLARELDAGVVTEDRGIIAWAEDFGLRYLQGRDFPALLYEYLASTDSL